MFLSISLYSRDPYMCTSVNSEDTDDSSGSTLFVKVKNLQTK